MSPLVTLPKALRDGIDPQSGADVIANFNAMLAVLNGGIAADNISPTAGIPGTRLSNVAGSQIPTDRLADKCVDSRVLKSDASTGAPQAAIQNGSYVKDGALPGKKLTASTLGADVLKIGTVNISPGGVLAAGVYPYDTGIDAPGSVALGYEIRRGAAEVGTTTNCHIHVYLNTSTNRYYVVVTIPAGVSQDFSGATIQFKYLTVASS